MEKEVTITWDGFDAKFKPIKNTITNRDEFNECLFETYGEDEEHVIETAKTKPNNVWTIVDTDGELMVISGLHFVNRFGYFITEIPAEESINYTAIDDDFESCPESPEIVELNDEEEAQ